MGININNYEIGDWLRLTLACNVQRDTVTGRAILHEGCVLICHVVHKLPYQDQQDGRTFNQLATEAWTYEGKKLRGWFWISRDTTHKGELITDDEELALLALRFL